MYYERSFIMIETQSRVEKNINLFPIEKPFPLYPRIAS